MVTATFSIHHYPVIVLFDSRDSHLFAAPGIVDKSKLIPFLRSCVMYVTMPIGNIVRCEKLYIGSPILIVGQEFKANLYHFNLIDFDVILSVDWL